MKKTVLHDLHIARKAKMTAFSGFEMPLSYDGYGIIKEHALTRTAAAMFDTCHMGEFKIRGNGATRDLENLLSRTISDMKIGTCRCAFLCNEKGGVIDDQILYRIGENEFMMVVNAGGRERDFDWVKSHLSQDTSVENLSDDTAKIDIHGPLAPKIIVGMIGGEIASLKFFNFTETFYNGKKIIVSRTGYTGEIGFEIYCPQEIAAEIWNEGIARGATPAGLGARDTLRLEMGYPLHGHELTADRNAAQSDFGYAISRDKKFIGSEAIFADGAKQLLRGVRIEGRRTARHGDVITDAVGNEIGVVTSGSFSPTLGYAIALAYVNKEFSSLGTPLIILCGANKINGSVCELPFYKNGTARHDIKSYL